MNNNFKVNNKVKIKKDIPSINGMLRKGTVVKIDEIVDKNPVRGPIRVIDSLGKIWWISEEDIEI